MDCPDPSEEPNLNTGNPWSTWDDQDIKRALDHNHSIEEIANFLCRTPSEVRQRMEEIAEADAIGDPSSLRDRLTHRDRIALETYRDARAALALIPDAVEECAPPGSVRPETSGLACLVSVGLVGVLILAVFFGIGFFLLPQNTEQIVGGSGAREGGTEVEPLGSSVFPRPYSDARSVPIRDARSVPIRAELPPSAATAPLRVAPLTQAPAAREAPMPENSDPAGDAPVSAATGALLSRAAPALTSTAREATLTPPATVSPVELKSSFPGATTPATPPARARPAAAKVAELLARGDSFIVVGDIASARVFYERAADAGDRRAALRMGATFDPAFLSRAGLHSTLGDPAQARSWYRRALDLGGARAERRRNGGDIR
jgi:hypothetical protein